MSPKSQTFGSLFLFFFVAHDADNSCRKGGGIALAKAIVQVPGLLHLMDASHCAVYISGRRLWHERLEMKRAFRQLLVDFNEEERVFLFFYTKHESLNGFLL